MISKYPHDPNVVNFRGAPGCGKRDAVELADIIKDMESAGFKLGNVLAVMGDRNGSRSGMFACFDTVGLAFLKISLLYVTENSSRSARSIFETVADSRIGRRTTCRYCVWFK